MIAFLTATIVGLVTGVHGHGMVISPPSRGVGPAMAAACGQAAVEKILADPTRPLEDLEVPPTCELDLCRGALFEDNQDKVQVFAPGEVVQMKVNLNVLHKGPANVSIVDTAINQVIGSTLVSFDTYADDSLAQLPKNNTEFSVTIPSNVPSNMCKQAGACVLQWYWFASESGQSYESCVDFIIQSTPQGSLPGAATPAKPGNGTAQPITQPGSGNTTVLPVTPPSSGNNTAQPIVPPSSGNNSTRPITPPKSGDNPAQPIVPSKSENNTTQPIAPSKPGNAIVSPPPVALNPGSDSPQPTIGIDRPKEGPAGIAISIPAAASAATSLNRGGAVGAVFRAVKRVASIRV